MRPRPRLLAAASVAILGAALTAGLGVAAAAPAATGAIPATAPRGCALYPVPPPPPRITAVSDVIFLNDCRAAGSCDLVAGRDTMTNDSRTNTSSIATADRKSVV
jgi:hypothetical protein